MFEPIKFIASHRRVLLRITATELKSRYAGSYFGAMWALLSPFLLLAVYAVVYLYIFKLQPGEMTVVQYILYIFCGLVPYIMSSEAVSVGLGSVVNDKTLLSNTVFPIDLTPVKAVLLCQGSQLAGFALVFIVAAQQGLLTIHALFFPVVWVLQLMFLIGLSWILSLLNILLRDLTHVISVILIAILIVSPIAYTMEMVGSSARLLVYLNPFAYYILFYQKILVQGQLPSLFVMGVTVVQSIVIFLLGAWFFPSGKKALIDYV